MSSGTSRLENVLNGRQVVLEAASTTSAIERTPTPCETCQETECQLTLAPETPCRVGHRQAALTTPGIPDRMVSMTITRKTLITGHSDEDALPSWDFELADDLYQEGFDDLKSYKQVWELTVNLATSDIRDVADVLRDVAAEVAVVVTAGLLA